TRSVSPENFTGAKGQGGMATEGPAAHAARGLGQGWKISPYIVIAPGETRELANIEGQGAIQQIWMTMAGGKWRHAILRAGWERFAQVSALPVCVNPGRAFNCYWEMPFRRRARFAMTNLSDEKIVLYY